LNDLDTRPAFKLAVSVLGGSRFLYVATENLDGAGEEELVIAAYQGMVAMRKITSYTREMPKTDQSQLEACSKIERILGPSSFPQTLPGLWDYLHRTSQAGRMDFVRAVMRMIAQYTLNETPQRWLGHGFIATPASCIDDLLRPKWHEHLLAIKNAPKKAMRMAGLVLNEGSKVQCRHWLLADDKPTYMFDAFRFGLIELSKAVELTLSQCAEETTEHRAAAKLKTRYGSWPTQGVELIQRLTEKKYTVQDGRWICCVLYNCISHSTAVVEERRVVIRDPPEDYPTPSSLDLPGFNL